MIREISNQQLFALSICMAAIGFIAGSFYQFARKQIGVYDLRVELNKAYKEIDKCYADIYEIKQAQLLNPSVTYSFRKRSTQG